MTQRKYFIALCKDVLTCVLFVMCTTGDDGNPSLEQLSDLDSFVSDKPLVALVESDDESSGDGSAAIDTSSGIEEPSSGQEEKEGSGGGGEFLSLKYH